MRRAPLRELQVTSTFGNKPTHVAECKRRCSSNGVHNHSRVVCVTAIRNRLNSHDAVNRLLALVVAPHGVGIGSDGQCVSDDCSRAAGADTIDNPPAGGCKPKDIQGADNAANWCIVLGAIAL